MGLEGDDINPHALLARKTCGERRSWSLSRVLHKTTSGASCKKLNKKNGVEGAEKTGQKGAEST